MINNVIQRFERTQKIQDASLEANLKVNEDQRNSNQTLSDNDQFLKALQIGLTKNETDYDKTLRTIGRVWG